METNNNEQYYCTPPRPPLEKAIYTCGEHWQEGESTADCIVLYDKENCASVASVSVLA